MSQQNDSVFLLCPVYIPASAEMLNFLLSHCKGCDRIASHSAPAYTMPIHAIHLICTFRYNTHIGKIRIQKFCQITSKQSGIYGTEYFITIIITIIIILIVGEMSR